MPPAIDPSTTPPAPSATLENFLPLRGQSFRLRPGGYAEETVELVLVESLGFGTPEAGGAGRESFRLLFRAPRGWRHPQQVFQVTHAQAGDFGGIFIVPVGPDTQGVRLEAIFNFG